MSHLDNVDEEELDHLLGIVVDVENLFKCVAKEEDADTKKVYFYLFKVGIYILGEQWYDTTSICNENPFNTVSLPVIAGLICLLACSLITYTLL